MKRALRLYYLVKGKQEINIGDSIKNILDENNFKKGYDVLDWSLNCNRLEDLIDDIALTIRCKKMAKDGKYSKYYIVLKEPSELYDSNNVFSFLTTKNSTEASIESYISIQTMTKNWKDNEKFFTYVFESVEDLLKLI